MSENEKLETLKSLYLQCADSEGQEREELREQIEQFEQYFFNVIPKDNGKIFYSHDNITRQLYKYVLPIVPLNDPQKNEQRAVACVDLLDVNTNQPLKKPLSLYEKAVIIAVFSLINAGNTSFSGAQIYRKMRGNSNAKPTEEALNELHNTLMYLQTVRINIDCVDEKGNINEEAIKIIGQKRVVYPLFIFQAGKGKANEILIKGKIPQWSYTLWAKPDLKSGKVDYCPYLTMLKRINQYEELKDEILNIKKINGKTVQLTNDRIAITQSLFDFVNMFNHMRGNRNNKKSYKKIFEESGIKTTQPKQEQRFKEFIQIVMNHFKNNGLIADFNEYGNGDGVQIKTTKKPTTNHKKKKALSTGNR